jgi:hypothetical protein
VLVEPPLIEKGDIAKNDFCTSVSSSNMIVTIRLAKFSLASCHSRHGLAAQARADMHIVTRARECSSLSTFDNLAIGVHNRHQFKLIKSISHMGTYHLLYMGLGIFDLTEIRFGQIKPN